jgi:hydroxymethylpyrimidine/phosphomethylpyrimidine kinase
MASSMTAPKPKGRVLAIGGSDSGAGAGVQADIKTVMALGGYATTAITAVTVQDTTGVHYVFPVPATIVEGQAKAVLDDIGADAIKIGMLSQHETVEAVVRLVSGPARGIPLVVDPVLISTSGANLLDRRGFEELRALLLPKATLLTPNIPEAQALTGIDAETLDGRRQAAEAMLRAGTGAVLVKGGHAKGSRVVDLLSTPHGETLFEGERSKSRHTHGTGCTLAAAAAAGLALGLGLEDAVAQAWAFTAEAIRRAPRLGRGRGPLDHGWRLRDEA